MIVLQASAPKIEFASLKGKIQDAGIVAQRQVRGMTSCGCQLESPPLSQFPPRPIPCWQQKEAEVPW